MAKCTACNGTILFGGVKNRNGQYCSEDCVLKHRIAVADEVVPRIELMKFIDVSFQKECPQCKGTGPLDLHKATKITSYLIAYTVTTSSVIGCAKCGKSHKIKAGVHTLFLGIWSVRGLLHSLIYFPAGIIGGLTTSVGKEPSRRFGDAIKAGLGEDILSKSPVGTD